MVPQALPVMLLALVVATGCAASKKGGAGAPGADESRGDAARIICEAECRRDERCHPDAPAAECFARCPTLPVRQPPVWSAGWASEVAHCIDLAACAHDAEEGCVLASARHTALGDTCQAQAETPKAQRRCGVLQGLTPAAEQQVQGCLRAGQTIDACTPEYDWK